MATIVPLDTTLQNASIQTAALPEQTRFSCIRFISTLMSTITQLVHSIFSWLASCCHLTKSDPSIPPLNVTPVPLSLSLQKLRRFMNNLEECAPNSGQATTLHDPVHNLYYKVWKSAHNETLYIQAATDWQNSNNNNKIGIKINEDDDIVYSSGDEVLPGIPFNQEALLSRFAEDLAIKKVIDEKKQLFNPESLKLLLTFFQGPGSAHMRDARVTTGLGFNNPYTIPSTTQEPNMRVWAVKEVDGAVASSPGVVAPERFQYFLNIQDADNYTAGSPNGKLGLCIKEDGTIASFRIDGENIAVTELENRIYRPGSEWNIKLTKLIHTFLDNETIRIGEHGDIQLHPLALAQRPETVLDRLCMGGSFRAPNRNVRFLTDQLVYGPAIDAGGPTAELITTLGQHLFDNASGRTLRMEPGSDYPIFSKPFTPESNQVLQNIGRFLAKYQSTGEGSVGRVVDDGFFMLIRHALTSGTLHSAAEPTVDQIFAAANAAHQLKPDIQQDWLFAYCNHAPVALSEAEKDLLVDAFLIYDDRTALDTAYAQNPVDVQRAIREYLADAWKDRFRAAWGVAKGIPQAQLGAFSSLNPTLLSSQIQGEAFDRNRIIAKIQYTSDPQNAVVVQKVQWLKELVRDQPQDWVERLLFAVTARRSISAHSKFDIINSYDAGCHSHTCFQRVDLPTTHDVPGLGEPTTNNKQKFLNSLDLLLSQTGYDAG